MTLRFELRGPIDDTTSEEFRSFIQSANGEPIECFISSEGGLVASAFAMANALQEYTAPKIAIVELALSAAGYLSLFFDEIRVHENGLLMLHKSHVDGATDVATRKILERLNVAMAKALGRRLGLTPDEALTMLAKEKFWGADEALRSGLANEIIPADILFNGNMQRHELMAMASSSDPAKQWRARIDLAKASGLSYEQAFAKVDAEHPALRRAMLAKKQTAAPKLVHNNATATWKLELAKARLSGKQHAQAVASVLKSHPGLRESMLQEVNANRGRGRR